MYQHYLCIYSFLYIESHGTLNTTLEQLDIKSIVIDHVVRLLDDY
jgi:hypothetical protein